MSKTREELIGDIRHLLDSCTWLCKDLLEAIDYPPKAFKEFNRNILQLNNDLIDEAWEKIEDKDMVLTVKTSLESVINETSLFVFKKDDNDRREYFKSEVVIHYVRVAKLNNFI